MPAESLPPAAEPSVVTEMKKAAAPLCYIWGSVDWEQHWDSNNEVKLHFPTPFTALNDMQLMIEDVACGAKHTILITQDGRAFAFGNNAKGQLGLSSVPYTYTPLQTARDKGHFVQAACGVGHTLLRTREGKVFSFGANECGQLGTTTKIKKIIETPTRVTGAIEFLNITQIAAGGEISFALSEEGKVYGWGSVQYGALGIGTNGKYLEEGKRKEAFHDEERPVLISFFTEKGLRIQKIAAGARHLLALTDDHKLYTCGYGAFGRLGQGTDTHDKVTPVPLTWYTRKEIEIVDIIAGAEHSMCTAKMGQHLFVYFWGRTGSDVDGVMTPISLDSLCGIGVNHLSAGKGMSVACCDGDLAIWGDNSLCSNLGLMGMQKNKRTEPKVMEVLSKQHITSAYCGGWHMLAFADPDRSKGDVMPVIPKEGRYPKTGFTQIERTPWEDIVKIFYSKCAGVVPPPTTSAPSTAAAAVPKKAATAAGKRPSSAQQSSAKKPKAEPKKAKVAAAGPKKALSVGSNVKVWFDDEFVSGTILAKEKGRHEYNVSWSKEGWKDEVVTLKPEDMTDDEDNIDRWLLVA
eukprot:NODE_339_length_1766_cov_289.506698_g275_i0.p1 GENE.NODE_339_length_1766_cov_289.506698_g275_i0~~NODE_339_length_1766_cov_289.506698_g275_i0.p1  ORF type:complete len:575 (-),score=130.57 NODE_339_length_1766_cov_289.506698_g275_i0:23-1747(-)